MIHVFVVRKVLEVWKVIPALIEKCGKKENAERVREKWRVLHRTSTLGLAIWRTLADFPHVPWVLTVRMQRTTLCLVPSTASWHARRSSASSALDFAISSPIWNQERVRSLCEEGVCLLLFLAVSLTKCHKRFSVGAFSLRPWRLVLLHFLSATKDSWRCDSWWSIP